MSEVRKPVIVVHGGAGTWHPERSQKSLVGIKEATKTSFEILKHGGSTRYA